MTAAGGPALCEQLPPRGGDADRHAIGFDEAAVVCVFPHRQPRTRGAPGGDHFVIAAFACDELEEIEDEIFDGCFSHTLVITACAGE